MVQLSSKYDDSSLCYDVIITNQKILKIDNFGVFSSDIDFKSKMDIFSDDIPASRAAQAGEARL